MPHVEFSALPAHARLWIFAAERPLAAQETTKLLGQVDAFVGGWKAHEAPLTAARDWRHNQFLLVAVDERAAGVSGCSIDALTRTLKGLQAELGVTLLETAPVFYRDGGNIRRATRGEFRALAERGTVDTETIVFDNTVITVEALERWESKASATWHAKAFPLKTGVASSE
jgi:hypothetical protein